MYIDNIDHEGILNIEVSQEATRNGYIFGNQKTNGKYHPNRYARLWKINHW